MDSKDSHQTFWLFIDFLSNYLCTVSGPHDWLVTPAVISSYHQLRLLYPQDQNAELYLKPKLALLHGWLQDLSDVVTVIRILQNPPSIHKSFVLFVMLVTTRGGGGGEKKE